MFYKNKKIIDDILKSGKCNFPAIRDILKSDQEAAIYFYENNDNPEWLDVLYENGEFQRLDKFGETEPLERIKTGYLTRVANEKSKEVLAILSNIESKDLYVVKHIIEAVLNMPPDEQSNALPVIYKYIEQPIEWWWCGEQIAELMVKLIETNPDKAFEVAAKLIEIRGKTEEEKARSFGEATAKFSSREFKDFVYKYFNKLWETDAFRASKLLIDSFDNYMNSLTDSYELETGYYHSIENIEKPEETYHDHIIVIVTQAICKAGKAVIERQEEQINNLLGYLSSKNKLIFNRIIMYLLRYVPAGLEDERINSILGNKIYLKRKGEAEYWYEYRLLLRDKFNEISNETKKYFENWIKSLNQQDDIESWNEWYEKFHKDKNREEFLKQYEARERARELYLVREQYPELFKSLSKEAGFKESDAAPRPRVWTPSHEEIHGVPEIGVDDPIWNEPDKAIDFLIAKKEWKLKKKGWGHDSPEGEQAQVFREVLGRKFSEYFAVDAEKLSRLPEPFLQSFMNCALVSISVADIVMQWEKILNLSELLIGKYFVDPNYRHIFEELLRVLDKCCDTKQLKEGAFKEFNEKFLPVIQQFLKYKYDLSEAETDRVVLNASSRKQDPFSEAINRMPGKAIQIIIRTGVIAKNKEKEYYERHVKETVISNLRWAIDNIADYNILSIFGVWMPQLWYLDGVFFDEFVERVWRIPEGDESQEIMWDAVWGTYMSWGRPSPTIFELLKEKNRYAYAIEKVNEEDRFGRKQKTPADGLIEHLMIAYFNEWIEFGDELLTKFFEIASVDRRAKAADFFTTGFEAVKKKNDEGENARTALISKRYWKERLEVMSSDPKANFKEALEFTVWVKDSLLTPEDTLVLLEQTLELTNGKVSERGDLVRFVKGVCDISKGNELSAIRCLKSATVNDYFASYHSMFKDELSSLLSSILEFKGADEITCDIWKETVLFTDTLGRMRIYDYEEIYKELSKRLDAGQG